MRFTDNGDGTVTDNLTALIWLKNANCFGAKNWATALSDANALASGSCGLSDGSIAGGWRLPNGNELHSLIDLAQSNPALPAGHPFTGVQVNLYWTSTTGRLQPVGRRGRGHVQRRPGRRHEDGLPLRVAGAWRTMNEVLL